MAIAGWRDAGHGSAVAEVVHNDQQVVLARWFDLGSWMEVNRSPEAAPNGLSQAQSLMLAWSDRRERAEGVACQAGGSACVLVRLRASR